MSRVEAGLVAGALLHPELLPQIVGRVEPVDLESIEHREVWRDIIAAWHGGYFNGRTGIDRGYRAVGAYMRDHGTWTGRLFRFGDVDSSDPLGAARVIAERSTRRKLSAELAQAAADVASGSDPAAVLARLGVAA